MKAPHPSASPQARPSFADALPALLHAPHSPLAAALSRADAFAAREAPILLLGESGTGKEGVARRIHARSRRASGPFIAVNCGATPENLWESEWFGCRKGAFTGADADREGLLAAARGGTLFLDEIGEMPLSAQARLLRVLQEKTVRPLGGIREIPVDFRLIAATHRPLAEKVEAGSFRLDLLYRVQVLELELPPLRTRPGDAVLLLRHFLSEVWGEVRAASVTSLLRTRLEAHPFPGNVRELRNCAERLLATGEEAGPAEWMEACRLRLPESDAMATPARRPPSSPLTPLRLSGSFLLPNSRLTDADILAALAACGHHRRLASEKLGITRRALQYRIARLAGRTALA